MSQPSRRSMLCGLAIAFLARLPTSLAADPAATAKGPLQIGSQRELFVDEWLVDKMQGVRLELQQPVDRGKVFDLNLPWEGLLSNYGFVFPDNDKWRMYYRGGRLEMQKAKPNSSNICYAESSDGLQWTKPNMDLYKFGDTRENNIVYMGPGTAGGWYCFKDTNPAAPPDQRYKALSKLTLGYSGPLGVMVSADGSRWTWLRDEPVITQGTLDSLSTVCWDPQQQKYLAFVRNFASRSKGWNSPPEDAEGTTPFFSDPDRFRAIALTTSTDFIHWTPQQWLNYGNNAPFENLYTNAVTPYFRAPHIYVAFPMRLVPDREVISGWAGSTLAASKGCSDAVFMSSRDGLHWDRRFLEAFVRPGLEPSNWTDRNMIVFPGIVQTGPGEMSLYYVSHYGHETTHVRRLSLRLDGFVSVRADYRGGELLTKPLVFSGKELLINYSTSAVGDVRVEIQNADGTPIQGFSLAEASEIVGDQIERVVAWHGGSDLSALAGQPVRLRFVMKDADVYSIRFRASQ